MILVWPLILWGGYHFSYYKTQLDHGSNLSMIWSPDSQLFYVQIDQNRTGLTNGFMFDSTNLSDQQVKSIPFGQGLAQIVAGHTDYQLDSPDGRLKAVYHCSKRATTSIAYYEGKDIYDCSQFTVSVQEIATGSVLWQVKENDFYPTFDLPLLSIEASNFALWQFGYLGLLVAPIITLPALWRQRDSYPIGIMGVGVYYGLILLIALCNIISSFTN